MTRRSPPRGFTLIELMIVVAIIGILASIAAPMAQHATLRARAAERPVVSRAIAKAVEDVYASAGNVSVMVGTPNPAGVASRAKRPMDWTLGEWAVLRERMTVEGNVYYTYAVAADEAAAPYPTLTITATGNLDGDAIDSVKVWYYERRDGAYILASESPPPGQEDTASF